MYDVAILVPIVFYKFIHVLVEKEENNIFSRSYLFGLILLLSNHSSTFRQGVFFLSNNRFVTIPGVGWFVFLFYFIALIGISLNVLYKVMMGASGQRRNRLKYFLFSTNVLALGGLFYFVLIIWRIPLPMVVLFNLLSSLLLSVFVVMASYIILKYKLMDITIVIRKGLIYSILIGFFTGLYILMLYFFSSLLGGLGTRTSIYFSALLIIFFAITFQPLRDKIQGFIDKVFFRGKYDYQKTLKDLSLAARSIAGIDELFDKILIAIVSIIKLKNASIYVLDKRGGQYIVRKSIGIDLRISVLSQNDDIIRLLLSGKEAIMSDETSKTSGNIWGFMRDIGAAIVFPMIAKDELVGFLCLGEKLSGEVYSDEDIDLLTTLCNQMGVSIENAMLYEDAMEAQKHLYQADKLSTVGALAAGLAHEIKNPIAAIKGFTQVLDKAVRDNDQETLNDFKEVVPRQLDRINEIVEKLLTLSKPQKLERINVAINKVLEDIIRLVEKQALKQKVQIIKTFDDIPQTLADPQQLTQAFLNLILNAIQAMPDGGALEIRTKFVGTDKILIEFIDNGIGIAKDKLSHIFDPFFTTKAGGSGLGLSVTRKIILDHHGKLDVESEIGKGTKFTLIIPVNEELSQ
jgi:signal transduction histidine kinase